MIAQFRSYLSGEEEGIMMAVKSGEEIEEEGISITVKNGEEGEEGFSTTVKNGEEGAINWRLVSSIVSDVIAYGSVISNFIFYNTVQQVYDKHDRYEQNYHTRHLPNYATVIFNNFPNIVEIIIILCDFSKGCNNGINIVDISNAVLAFGIIGVLLQVATTILLIRYWRAVYAYGLENEGDVRKGSEVPLGFAAIILQDIPLSILSSTFEGRCKGPGGGDYMVAIVVFFMSFSNMLSTSCKFRYHKGQLEVGIALSVVIIVLFIYWAVVVMS